MFSFPLGERLLTIPGAFAANALPRATAAAAAANAVFLSN
jgi:hypothetical protein